MSERGAPVAEIYFATDLFGKDMNNITSAMEELGFEIDIDPLRPQATMYRIEEVQDS